MFAAQVAKAFDMERLKTICDSFLGYEVEGVPKSTFDADLRTIFNDKESSEVSFSFPSVRIC